MGRRRPAAAAPPKPKGAARDQSRPSYTRTPRRDVLHPGRHQRVEGLWTAGDIGSATSGNDPGNDPRVLALSERLAIVLTLLVRIPDLAGGQSLETALREVRLLVRRLPNQLWAGHRDLPALIGRTDRVLVWLNILYLLPCPFCPLAPPSSPATARNRSPSMVTLLVAISLTRMVIWWYGDNASPGGPGERAVPAEAGSSSWRLPRSSTRWRSSSPSKPRPSAS